METPGFSPESFIKILKEECSMEIRKFGVAVLAVVVAAAIAGCSSVPKKYKEEIAGIKTKVDTLESRVDTVESKQAYVEKAATEQSQTLEELKAQQAQKSVSKSNISILDRTGSPKGKTRDIQTALRNAGFYDGKIDGVKGEQTRKAIKAFQNANGLRDDGVVGPKTWDILSRYLSEAGAGAGGKSESAE
jgi:murein L,D-transpeptidase YcbB/YkuD